MVDMNAILAGCVVIDDDTNDPLPGVPNLALYSVTRGDDFGGEREPALAINVFGLWCHVPAHREAQHPDAILVRVESAADRREAAEGAEELRRQLEREDDRECAEAHRDYLAVKGAREDEECDRRGLSRG